MISPPWGKCSSVGNFWQPVARVSFSQLVCVSHHELREIMNVRKWDCPRFPALIVGQLKVDFSNLMERTYVGVEDFSNLLMERTYVGVEEFSNVLMERTYVGVEDFSNVLMERTYVEGVEDFSNLLMERTYVGVEDFSNLLLLNMERTYVIPIQEFFPPELFPNAQSQSR